jgi:hypothetical protein
VASTCGCDPSPSMPPRCSKSTFTASACGSDRSAWTTHVACARVSACSSSTLHDASMGAGDPLLTLVHHPGYDIGASFHMLLCPLFDLLSLLFVFL